VDELVSELGEKIRSADSGTQFRTD
jgi:hypothetical protein